MRTGVSIVFDLEKDQELVWGSGTGRGRLGSLGGDGRVWLHQAADGREHCSGVCVLSVLPGLSLFAPLFLFND